MFRRATHRAVVFAVILFVMAIVVRAQDIQPTWVLGRDAIDPLRTNGKVEIIDGVVKLDGTQSFAVPVQALGDQNDYTIEFEVQRTSDARGAVMLVSNTDDQNKCGLKLMYFPPDYNAAWLYVNSYQTLEQRGFLGSKFDKVTILAKDKQLMIFRNGLILATTEAVKPSELPLTFGSVEKAPTATYELRNIRIYNTAIFPTGFDQSAERMRNYSGDGYFMQRVTIKDRALPRILVVGDSISMGYRSTITKHFEGKAYVDYWVGGSWFAWTVKDDDFPALRAWEGVLSNGPYDVVSWNAMTLHMWTPDQPDRCNYETYPAHLTRVLEHLRKIAPKTKFIWIRCTPYTTPVDGKPSVIDEKKSERLVRFNNLTDGVMKKYDIPEVDLYALCEKNLDKASKDCVHWNADASRLMGEEIIKAIEQHLPVKQK